MRLGDAEIARLVQKAYAIVRREAHVAPMSEGPVIAEVFKLLVEREGSA